MNLAQRPCKVFFIEPTGRHARLLRRYGDNPKCHPEYPETSYCDAMVHIGDFDGEGNSTGLYEEYKDDPRWPTLCEHCGRPFSELPAQAQQQVFIDPIYRRKDGSQQAMFRQFQKMAGAMWNQSWLNDIRGQTGPDGLSLVIICPDGESWGVDGRASNCAMKDDKVHKCWVRHGDLDHLTVNKDGLTCAAGQGSIQTGHWHGFLRNGFLVDA